MISISVETRASVTRHYLDSAIDAFAIGNAVNVMRIPTGRRSLTLAMMKNSSNFYKHVESISRGC